MNPAQADPLDDCVVREMRAHAIPGVSLAIIENSRIVSTRTYGNTDEEGGAKINSETLFQAGSVSKAVTALGALLLVQQEKLSLDEDVNLRLKDWKIPDNQFTADEKVTVRRLLSHTAGLTVHGFPGYSRDLRLPPLLDILNGTGIANTAAIRVTSIPGSQWRYSGGGYIVLQKLMIDVTGQPFPTLMSEMILNQLHMGHSTFDQPLPSPLETRAAAGHTNGKRIPGRWNLYPEMAAAGLWSTPSDLGLLVIALQRALAGQNNGVISPALAREMTTPVLDHDGLGLFLSGPRNEIFGHAGRNLGFDSLIRASAQDGVVLMINANDDTGVCKKICQAAWAQATLSPSYRNPPE